LWCGLLSFSREVSGVSLIQTVLELHTLDQEWDEKARRYQAARQRLADRSTLEAQREAQQRRTEGVTHRNAMLRDAELELGNLQQKARDANAALYGGRIRQPKELEDLRQDGEYLKKRIAQLEDQVLTAMAEVEELESMAKEAAAELQTAEARWNSEHQALVPQAEALRIRLKELQGHRETLRATLGRAELALYDELRTKKAGAALAPLKDGMCQTCRVTVPSRKIHLVEQGQTLALCEGCGRILYHG
jgi:uncharacterized protein